MTDATPVSIEVPLPTAEVALRDHRFGNRQPLFLIAGPCVIESEETLRTIARHVKAVTSELGIPYVFKASYDKANRTAVTSFRGPGQREGLQILKGISDEFDLPLCSDVHTPDEVAAAGEILDIVQIPAFLCRQTDLLVEAGKTGKIVNIKKAQFLAPHDMVHAVNKVRSTGNEKIMLTERGTSFGYNTLVVDMRGIRGMQRTCGVPVVFDCGHSVQSPGGLGGASGGDRASIPALARAAVAAGCDGLFMETHPDPANAKSDGPNMWPLNQIGDLLRQLRAIRTAIQIP